MLSPRPFAATLIKIEATAMLSFVFVYGLLAPFFWIFLFAVPAFFLFGLEGEMRGGDNGVDRGLVEERRSTLLLLLHLLLLLLLLVLLLLAVLAGLLRLAALCRSGVPRPLLAPRLVAVPLLLALRSLLLLLVLLRRQLALRGQLLCVLDAERRTRLLLLRDALLLLRLLRGRGDGRNRGSTALTGTLLGLRLLQVRRLDGLALDSLLVVSRDLEELPRLANGSLRVRVQEVRLLDERGDELARLLHEAGAQSRVALVLSQVPAEGDGQVDGRHNLHTLAVRVGAGSILGLQGQSNAGERHDRVVVRLGVRGPELLELRPPLRDGVGGRQQHLAVVRAPGRVTLLRDQLLLHRRQHRAVQHRRRTLGGAQHLLREAGAEVARAGHDRKALRKLGRDVQAVVGLVARLRAQQASGGDDVLQRQRLQVTALPRLQLALRLRVQRAQHVEGCKRAVGGERGRLAERGTRGGGEDGAAARQHGRHGLHVGGVLAVPGVVAGLRGVALRLRQLRQRQLRQARHGGHDGAEGVAERVGTLLLRVGPEVDEAREELQAARAREGKLLLQRRLVGLAAAHGVRRAALGVAAVLGVVVVVVGAQAVVVAVVVHDLVLRGVRLQRGEEKLEHVGAGDVPGHDVVQDAEGNLADHGREVHHGLVLPAHVDGQQRVEEQARRPGRARGEHVLDLAHGGGEGGDDAVFAVQLALEGALAVLDEQVEEEQAVEGRKVRQAVPRHRDGLRVLLLARLDRRSRLLLHRRLVQHQLQLLQLREHAALELLLGRLGALDGGGGDDGRRLEERLGAGVLRHTLELLQQPGEEGGKRRVRAGADLGRNLAGGGGEGGDVADQRVEGVPVALAQRGGQRLAREEAVAVHGTLGDGEEAVRHEEDGDLLEHLEVVRHHGLHGRDPAKLRADDAEHAEGEAAVRRAALLVLVLVDGLLLLLVVTAFLLRAAALRRRAVVALDVAVAVVAPPLLLPRRRRIALRVLQGPVREDLPHTLAQHLVALTEQRVDAGRQLRCGRVRSAPGLFRARRKLRRRELRGGGVRGRLGGGGRLRLRAPRTLEAGLVDGGDGGHGERHLRQHAEAVRHGRHGHARQHAHELLEQEVAQLAALHVGLAAVRVGVLVGLRRLLLRRAARQLLRLLRRRQQRVQDGPEVLEAVLDGALPALRHGGRGRRALRDVGGGLLDGGHPRRPHDVDARVGREGVASLARLARLADEAGGERLRRRRLREVDALLQRREAVLRGMQARCVLAEDKEEVQRLRRPRAEVERGARLEEALEDLGCEHLVQQLRRRSRLALLGRRREQDLRDRHGDRLPGVGQHVVHGQQLLDQDHRGDPAQRTPALQHGQHAEVQTPRDVALLGVQLAAARLRVQVGLEQRHDVLGRHLRHGAQHRREAVRKPDAAAADAGRHTLHKTLEDVRGHGTEGLLHLGHLRQVVCLDGGDAALRHGRLHVRHHLHDAGGTLRRALVAQGVEDGQRRLPLLERLPCARHGCVAALVLRVLRGGVRAVLLLLLRLVRRRRCGGGVLPERRRLGAATLLPLDLREDVEGLHGVHDDARGRVQGEVREERLRGDVAEGGGKQGRQAVAARRRRRLRGAPALLGRLQPQALAGELLLQRVLRHHDDGALDGVLGSALTTDVVAATLAQLALRGLGAAAPLLAALVGLLLLVDILRDARLLLLLPLTPLRRLSRLGGRLPHFFVC
eukprot:Rhum_TRINITY_DN14714_c9_g2::Rhum_TRINITY_DN14714_c9_g2_i1::g.113346::m.113346